MQSMRNEKTNEQINIFPQLNLLEQVKKISKNNHGIDSLITYGSLGRKQLNVNSDIDLAILVNSKFSVDEFKSQLHQTFKNQNLIDIIFVELRQLLVVYFNDKPKIEIFIIRELERLKRYYLGSKIPFSSISDTILFDRTNNVFGKIASWYKEEKELQPQEIINQLINKFIYEFENASRYQARNDRYKFYFFYNIALHVAIQLKYLSTGQIDFYYLPPKFTYLLDKEKLEDFKNLSSSLFLDFANDKKRNLLNFFYETIQKLTTEERFKNIKNILETLFYRDYIWNFRDIAKFNPLIKKGKIFRSATLAAYGNDTTLLQILKDYNIQTIIDLRADREIEKIPYDKNFIKKFNYFNVPLDPWKQPQWFIKTEHYGTNTEIAYRFFVKACKEEIKKIFEIIANEDNAILIHCYGGKDRTGVIIMLLHWLVRTPYEIILQDYLASDADTDKEKFNILYKEIENQGGIIKYLLSCGISEQTLNKIKLKLKK